jgi:hypothetical protein
VLVIKKAVWYRDSDPPSAESRLIIQVIELAGVKLARVLRERGYKKS